jgi:hypothetical protein
MKKAKTKTKIIPSIEIESKILFIRNKKVMLDKDLAVLYGVKPIRLREQVKRNKERFPEDFMFQITKDEATLLVSQNAIPSKKSLGGHLPYVFTEHGALMAANVIKSKAAIEASIAIVRTFVKLREMMMSYKELQKKIEDMERKYSKHDKHFQIIFQTIQKMLNPTEQPKTKIGFGT